MDRETPRYIRQNFLTLEQLSDASNVSDEEILRLIDKQCIPQHSYEITEVTEVSSFFGQRVSQRTVTRFYARTHLELIREATDQVQKQDLAGIARATKEEFFQEYRRQIRNGELDLPGLMEEVDVEVLLKEEWQAWLDGIYGLCTVEATAEDVAIKEISIRFIRKITADATKTSLTILERKRLQEAVDRLDGAASFFAPDERANSSRQRWIGRIVEKYELVEPPRHRSLAPTS